MDGDIFVVESASKGERTYDFFDDTDCRVVDGDRAVANMEARIETVREACDADHVVVALSDPGRRYFRHDLWPTYKAHRRSDPPTLLPHLRAWLEQNHKCYWKPKLEADDVLGILATGPFIRGTKVIASADKDMLQIPGEVLNPRKLDEGVRRVTAFQGERWHMVQTLAGDPVDNYPGCPRVPGKRNVGVKTAEKIVDEAIETAGTAGDDEFTVLAHAWSVVEAEFLARGATRDEFIVQARLAKILQNDNWDNSKKEIIPWEA